MYRLPPDWEKWISNPSESSPLRHLSGPWRGPDGDWHRGQGNIDDFYFATVFAEVAFYIQLMTIRHHQPITTAGSRPIRRIVNQL